MQTSLYRTPIEKQTPSPRPHNPRDEHDGRAWEMFERLVQAASEGRAARARDLAMLLADEGYAIEPIGRFGYRLVLPADRRAS